MRRAAARWNTTLRPTKHIFIEGINGSGKTTTAQFLTDHLLQHQIPARFLPEGGRGHPLRVAASLPHPFQVWRDVTADEFIKASLRKWHSFVNAARQSDAVTVCDGLLFHGNMMDLLLLNAEPNVFRTYVKGVIAALSDLQPVLIYYHADVAHALQRIGATRGADWIGMQVKWKLASPYGREQGLLPTATRQNWPESAGQIPLHGPGLAGLIHLFRDFRALSDSIAAELPIPKLYIDNTAGTWLEYYRDILSFLKLPPSAGEPFLAPKTETQKSDTRS